MTAAAKAETLSAGPPNGLAAVLAQVRAAATGESVSLATLLESIGRQSFSATLMLIGLLMVSPLSGIPGLPAIFAIIVLIIGVQALMSRDTLWLPRRLTNRKVRTERLLRALDTLERPARWLDRRASGRFSLLARRPLSGFAYLAIVVVALSWPPLSLIPFSATTTALGMTLIAAGLMLRDGVFVIGGYIYLGLLYGGGAMVIAGVI
ncbi:exopolysaccharide biosynthesis protein [Aestuariicoccus sp. MJ-SS9]|uniref:exopolysaccharide biosynthesis protein n=1 Tax=Aestuariicoccus sp. MJ-SS9 TaxID=3079855 RepID=UPI00290F2F16|nr:exopolysaccharide biosynthesis protein [Aestuariicoccus sp. MJ-SS9]MDU8911690.1 exopolysaccharide biosynthesis protein [Aestuariicoccus sp. MJ-SS9]